MRSSDWSSDVCSSDLAGAQLRIPVRIAQIAHVEHQVGMAGQAAREAEAHYVERGLVILCIGEALADFLLQVVAAVIGGVDDMFGPAADRFHQQIGRASGRKRGCHSVWTTVDDVSFKKKKK